MATPHITLHPEQKHLEKRRDGNLTGGIVLKFEAGRTGDLVLSRASIKNTVFCCVTWCLVAQRY